MVDFSNIGLALRKLRERSGLKQAEVATAAKITSPMLSAYENGKQKPSLVTIDKILNAMDMDVRHLSVALKDPGVGCDEALDFLDEEAVSLPRDSPLERQLGSIVDIEADHDASASEVRVLIRLLAGLLVLVRHVRDEP